MKIIGDDSLYYVHHIKHVSLTPIPTRKLKKGLYFPYEGKTDTSQTGTNPTDALNRIINPNTIDLPSEINTAYDTIWHLCGI